MATCPFCLPRREGCSGKNPPSCRPPWLVGHLRPGRPAGCTGHRTAGPQVGRLGARVPGVPHGAAWLQGGSWEAALQAGARWQGPGGGRLPGAPLPVSPGLAVRPRGPWGRTAVCAVVALAFSGQRGLVGHAGRDAVSREAWGVRQDRGRSLPVPPEMRLLLARAPSALPDSP